jgi:hypothetical protein
LTLVVGTGGLTHAASNASTPALTGTHGIAASSAPARPGHQGTRTQRPISGAPVTPSTAPVALPGSSACPLVGTVVASANAGGYGNYLNEVTALSTNELWSVGTFYNWDSAAYQTLVEHWSAVGIGWAVVPSPNMGTSHNQLYAVSASSANDVWAAGDYYAADSKVGHDATLIEHWDGAVWSVVPSDNLSSNHNNNLYGISAVSKEDVWAVGGYSDDPTGTLQTLIEHWDGVAWTAVPSPNMAGGVNSLYSVDAVTANDVWAVGEFYNTTNFSYHALIEHWDGTAWSIVPTLDLNMNNRYLYKVTARSATDVWAIGSTWDASNIDQTLVEHWNGSLWTAVASANVGTDSNNLYSIAATSEKDAWAVGDYYDAATSAYRTLVEHWDGRTWTAVLSPNTGTADNDLYGVATSGNDVWTVGTTTAWNKGSGETTTRTFTARYTPTCPLPNTRPQPQP